MARQLYYEDTDNQIRKEFRTFYPGIISYGNKAVDIKSTRMTTETFKCKSARCITLLHGKAAAMYNCWHISQFNLSVVELILVTEDGYSVIYKIDPKVDDTSLSTESIVVSVNFGKYDPNEQQQLLSATATNSENLEIYEKTRMYKFQHNNSVIHVGQNENIFNCNSKIWCLQCQPNEDNFVAFSTFHSEKSKTSLIEENKIICPPYTLIYDRNMLWLYNENTSDVSVGHYTEYPVPDLHFEQETISSILGPQAEIQDGTLKEGKFVTCVDYKRNYGTFVNVSAELFKNYINNAKIAA